MKKQKTNNKGDEELSIRRTALVSMIVILTVALVLSGCQGGGTSKKKYILTIETYGQGSVQPKAEKREYPEGTIVDLDATPADNWDFDSWLGDVAEYNSAKTTVVVDEDKTVRAVFANEDSIIIEVKDETGRGLVGVRLLYIGGLNSTNKDGRGILNMTAVDTIISPSLAGHAFEPRAVIAERGATLEFTASPQEKPLQAASTRELTFNTAEFNDEDKLNPFSSAIIREAMNRFISRDTLAEISKEEPLLTHLTPGSYDSEFMASKLLELENTYAYDKDHATTIITDEMLNMGATRTGDKWFYEGEPVELIFLIRSEDERKEMGDHIADELESIGFTVDRQYKTGAEAAPIWNQGDPREGRWHLYIGGWGVGNPYPTFLSHTFRQFYSPEGMNIPLWQSYEASPEFLEAINYLYFQMFNSVQERREAFETALELALEHSFRIWLTWDDPNTR